MMTTKDANDMLTEIAASPSLDELIARLGPSPTPEEVRRLIEVARAERAEWELKR